MTRAELHSIPGFHAQSLLAAAAHLRTSIPRGAGGDATALIRQGGEMEGYLKAIDALVNAASQQPANAPRPASQPYSAPENLNRK